MPIMLDGYATNKARARERSASESASGRDISGRWPGGGDAKRRKKCRLDLRRFLTTYFPTAFRLPFCADQIRVVDRIQDAVLSGGLSAIAMPRGYGKTTICQRSMLWALGYAHRRFGCVIGATERDSRQTLRSILSEILHNEEFGEDFPEVCFPFRATNGQTRMCQGQLWGADRTLVGMAQDELIFGTIPPADKAGVSGHVITVRAITGAIRGQQHILRDGTILRPDFVLLDDPQTRESAKSLVATDDRERIILGDVLGLGGNDIDITAVMPCTVICKGDVADRFLDRKTHPEWQGEKTKMVYSFPTAEGLWDTYREKYITGLAEDAGVDDANKFYRENQSAMDKGAAVAWTDSYPQSCLSAIQYAMNLRYLDLAAFMAERQNEPLDDSQDEAILTRDVLLAKVTRLPLGSVPLRASHLSAFIDVHGKLLYYVVCAWSDAFDGQVIEYGTYPQQNLSYFAQQNAQRTMASVCPGMTEQAYMLAGLTTLTDRLLAAKYTREDGTTMAIGKLLIDAHWSPGTDTVKTFCRRHEMGRVVLFPSFGIFIGASSNPWESRVTKPGETTGLHWRLMPESGGGRHVTIDVNFWKTFVANRLAMPLGTPGSIDLFKAKSGTHSLFIDHLCSEQPKHVVAKGDKETPRAVTEWRWMAANGDNHYWDCVVGCAVGASILGCKVDEYQAPKRKKQVLPMAELAARARRGR